MYGQEHTTIQGKEIVIYKFGAIQGWKIMRKLMSVLAPVMTEFTMGQDSITSAVETLFDRLSEQELIELMKKLTETCTIDGAKVIFDRDMGVNQFTIDLLTEIIKVNFEEFFTLAQEKVSGFLGTEETMKEATAPQKALS